MYPLKPSDLHTIRMPQQQAAFVHPFGYGYPQQQSALYAQSPSFASPYAGLGAPFADPAMPLQGVTVTRTIPEETAHWVIREAKAALRDVQTLDLARYLVSHIVEEHEDPSVARYSEMVAIHDFVTSRVRYTSDPFGIELVYGARAIVERILRVGKFAEDCDGFTVLSLALLLSIGHVAQVVLAGYTNVSGWQHIFVQDYMPGMGWITFDPSMKEEVRNVLANVDKIKAFPINAHLD